MSGVGKSFYFADPGENLIFVGVQLNETRRSNDRDHFRRCRFGFSSDCTIAALSTSSRSFCSSDRYAEEHGRSQNADCAFRATGKFNVPWLEHG